MGKLCFFGVILPALRYMQLYKFPYRAYSIAARVARRIGIAGPLRRSIGPTAGRFIHKISTHGNSPVVIQGHRMYLAAAGRYPPVNMAIDDYEKETTRLFKQLLEPGMVVIDIGAHVGYYSLLAARQVGPTGKVYAFEPEPTNHELLQKNIALNGYHNIVPFKQAVSNLPGTTNLYLTALDNGRHSTYHQKHQEIGSVEVETTTVDALLESEGWPNIDLVKVDVEGAEMHVLEGMAQLLQKPDELKLVIEFNPSLLQGAGVDPVQFLGKLASWRLKVHLIDEVDRLSNLDHEDFRSLADQLLSQESSLNLLCIK